LGSTSVTQLVDWAVDSPDAFRKYLGRWQSWQHQSRRFAAGPPDYLQFAASIWHRAAPRAAEYNCSIVNSMNTVCLHVPDQDCPFVFGLFIVPIIDHGVFIATDGEARSGPKTKEITDLCAGELVAGDAASDRIVYHIARTFEHDCHRDHAK